MWLTWRERLQQSSHLSDVNAWPFIDPLSLPMKKRRNFFRNREIVSRALAGQTLCSIASDNHLHSGGLCRMLDRCLGGDEDSPPALTKALIPNFRINESTRKKPLPKIGEAGGGANAFSHLLNNVPGLREYLHKQLRLYAQRSRRGQNFRIQNFHKAFLRYLTENNWPKDTYPFSHPTLASESLRRYFHQELQELRVPKNPTRVILPTHLTASIYEEIQIDEHTVDCRGSVVVELNNMWEALPLSRITLVAARDVATGAVLAYHLVLRGDACQDDILCLIEVMTSSWQPRILSMPELKFPPGNFMPTQLGEEFCRPAFGVFRFDNAMIHQALSVRDYICDTLGATLQLGIPKYPLARSLIESAFKDLNLSVHRIPSTTGSYPTDPLREPANHQKKVPIISLKVLEDMIHIHAATMNQRLMGNLGARSPIDVMKSQMLRHLVPLRPPLAQTHMPMVGREEVKVHWSSKEKRLPWVNFANKQYRGFIPPRFYGQKIFIQFDRRDIRELRAFSREGEDLGTLKAPLTWQRFPHSLVTARYIHKLVKADRLKAQDPFGGYYDYLTNHRELPTAALELIRITREFGQYAQPTQVLPPPEASKQHHAPRSPNLATKQPKNESRQPKYESSQPEVGEIDVPDWSTSMVDHRRRL